MKGKVELFLTIQTSLNFHKKPPLDPKSVKCSLIRKYIFPKTEANFQ